MKAFLAIFFTAFLISGCGGGDENIVQFNNAVAATMQREVEKEGISADVDARCRPVNDAYTCDVYVTYSDGKRQRIGDANNVRRTNKGIVWDRES